MCDLVRASFKKLFRLKHKIGLTSLSSTFLPLKYLDQSVSGVSITRSMSAAPPAAPSAPAPPLRYCSASSRASEAFAVTACIGWVKEKVVEEVVGEMVKTAQENM